MPLLIEELKDRTGLSESEIKEKLVEIMKSEHTKWYNKQRAYYDISGPAETYSDDSMGFISLILGDDPSELTKYLSK